MTAAARKANERRWRKAEGQVALSGWLSASDHAALTQMARDAGMTQGQVVSRLIGMVGELTGLERWALDWHPEQEGDALRRAKTGQWIRHSDLTAAVGL